VVADTPQNHLRGHALVDAIQQFFDEPRACLCGQQVKWRPSFELALGIPKPPPAALALTEYFLAQGNHTRDSNHAIRLVATQRFASCTPMGQRPARNDKGVDFLISQPGLAQGVDSSGRQSLLHECHQIQVRAQTLDAEDLLNSFEDTRVPNRFRYADLERALPGISRPTIARVLRELRVEGAVRCIKPGRDATWERSAKTR
jgi:hypothetical protein